MEGWRTMVRRSAEAEKRVEEQEALAEEFRAQAEKLLLRPVGAAGPIQRLGGGDHRKKIRSGRIEGRKRGYGKPRGGPAAFGGGAGRGPRQKERTVQTYQNSIDESESEIQKRRERLAALSGEGDALRERLTALNGEKLALEAERTAKTRAGQEMNETLLNLERAASRLEQKIATSAMEEKQILGPALGALRAQPL